MFCNSCGVKNCEDAEYCRNCGNPLNIKEFSIDYFVKQNKDLLVCLGVFGALTIYLRQISSGQCNSSDNTIHSIFGNFGYLDFGIASCLIIFLCFGLAIFIKLSGVCENTPKPFVFNFGNIIRMILIIPFGALILSIFYYVTANLSASSQILIIVIIGFLGGLTYFGFLKLFSLLISNWKYRWICSMTLFIILLIPMGYSIETKNYYLCSFISIFNTFNFLFVLFYPFSRFFPPNIPHDSPKEKTTIQIALDQLKDQK
jgi:hypothetical protein